MATLNIDGRQALNRTGIGERAGVALPTVDRWNARRAITGFPAPIPDEVTGQPTRRWWWTDEIDEFLAARAKSRRRRLTTVDRSGDPDDLLIAVQAARVLGYRSGNNLPDDFLACADEVELKGNSRPRRKWRRATIWAWADRRGSRHGGGPRQGSRNRLSNRTIDTSGDPDELVGSAEATRVLGYSANTSLPADLYERADETEVKPSGRTWHRWSRRTLWAYAAEDASP
ncbi:hypothetical protein BJF79_07385 [Actinomadura sp. CNU-125]|uniref:hypothetical protein n=1 Tax=Actinomadura sp. CNU-125 TaxID=1904961 RepID=UPI000962B1FA|nr:hypothetical protein [Actinomadura sp. CNU-125]OLT34381.1 hypothetical protein BJF79_07385 [Actinomadura sp. CNU-125]